MSNAAAVFVPTEPEGVEIDGYALSQYGASAFKVASDQGHNHHGAINAAYREMVRKAAMLTAAPVREEAPAADAHPFVQSHSVALEGCCKVCGRTEDIHQNAPAEAGEIGAEYDDAAHCVTLAACPPGLFLWNGTLGFKSEYGAMEPVGISPHHQQWKVGNRVDAYCADSGEYFWGGTSNHDDRAKLLVYPISAEAVAMVASHGLSALRAHPPAREDAQPVASAYRVRPEMNDPEEWTLMHPERAFDYLDRPGWETQPLYTHPAPDALRDSNLWWSAEDWELTFNSLEDAYDAATGGEMRGVAKLGRATEHDPVWALRIDFDTTGDGETDDYEIRLFRTVDDAYAYLAALQAEQKGGAA